MRDAPAPARLRRLLPAALLAAAAAFPSPGAAAPPPAQDPSAAEWNQWAGNPGRTGAVEVEPVRGEPRELWRVELPGRLLSEPVTWAGTVFVVAARGTGRVLLAYRIEDGELLATHYLRGKAERSRAAVWKGTVVVGGRNGAEALHHRGGFFQKGWRDEAECTAPLLVHEGTVYCGRLAADATSGSPRGGVPPGGPGSSHTATHRRGHPEIAVMNFGERNGYKGIYARLDIGPGNSLGKHLAMVRRGSGSSDETLLVRVDGSGASGGGWICLSTLRFRGVEEDFPALFEPDDPRGKGGLFDLRSRPTVWDGHAFGFDGSGDLLALGVDGRYSVLVRKGNLPHGARPGPGSRAGPVACFGNWAVDLPSGRVLWCLPDLEAATPLIPCGDRRLLYGTEAGQLVCLTDAPAAGASAGADGASGEPAPEAAAPAPAAAGEVPPPPASVGTGLLLVDGRAVEGEFDLYAGSSIRVLPGGKPEMLVPDHEVAAAFRDGKAVFVRDARPILEIWRRRIRARVLEELEGIFGMYTGEYLLRKAQRVLLEAREWGIDAAREEVMARALTGRKENPHAGNRLRVVEPKVAERRAALAAEVHEASDWCRERGFPLAGAAVLEAAVRLGEDGEETRRRARACIPPEFPWAGAKDAGLLWIRWASVLADSNATFVAPGDPVRRRAGGPWADPARAIVLRTPHLLFHSRVHDPEVVGRCLRNGETTVEVLTELLGRAAVRPVGSDADRLDVRLHRNPQEYMAEESPVGGYPMPWSAGYFSPAEGVSRFFVPPEDATDPLGRGLFSVLAHELTHHFLDRRWLPSDFGRRAETDHRGFWCVEGLARFVQDQVVELERRGRRWDDRTVPSLDTAAQAAAKGVLFPPHRFLEFTQGGFARLSDADLLAVTLRNTLGQRMLSGLALFYEQAGSTVFFLVHERGPEGRRALFDYAAAYYAGRDPGVGWKALGFASAAEFDARFREFLEKVR